MTTVTDMLAAAAASAWSALAAPLQDAHAPAAHSGGGDGVHAASANVIEGHLPWWVSLIVFLPLAGCVLSGVFAAMRVKTKLPAWTTVGLLGVAFVLTVLTYFQTAGGGGQWAVVHAFDWINLSWGGGAAGGDAGTSLVANFSFYVDSLTVLWMLFVTGLATLIALYASEYMSHDVGAGYCRFFAAFNLFVFSMACLVMGDNMLLLFLGWEGVGLCSYLLIGYFYKKPSAVAAAKKAFIMNRIGDLGLILGVMLTFTYFGTLGFAELFSKIAALEASGAHPWQVEAIPILLMIGAFGKSAQLPLYVWLPDAMEGPTPVSALIHAATMVTAGVYLIARFLPIFVLSDYALPIVAWTGTLTALLAATIGMAQFDIKRIMAYSTVSQLGYMFAGLAFLTAAGGAYHVFTHAFFKATLFLCCGAVMHGFAGQLDLRKLSGVAFMKGWGIVGVAMLIGCLNLSGFPFSAGFFSKDMILAEGFANPHAGYDILGWLLLLTAGLTAYYTFRVFFRVFVGPRQYQMGDERHDHEHLEGAQEHVLAEREARGELDPHTHSGSPPPPSGGDDHHHNAPHAPGWAINAVLSTLAIGSILAALPYFIGGGEGTHGGWVGSLVRRSTAGVEVHHAAHGSLLGMDPHTVMYFVSTAVGLIGIAIAFWLHYAGRTSSEHARADVLVPKLGAIATAARNKWYVDEIYGYVFVTPLRVLSHVLHLIDKLLVDGLVNLFGWLPRLMGTTIRPTQSGQLHGYALRMAGGVGLIIAIAAAIVVVGAWGGGS